VSDKAEKQNRQQTKHYGKPMKSSGVPLPKHQKSVDISNVELTSSQGSDPGKKLAAESQSHNAGGVNPTPPKQRRPKGQPLPLDDMHNKEITVREVDVSSTGKDQKSKEKSQSVEVLKLVIVLEYIYGILGLGLGITAIFGGIILGLNGVAGSTSWTANVLGLSSEINDAAPGVVLFIVGIFMLKITSPKVKIDKLKG